MPTVQSLLDTDLYKLSMMQFVLHQFSDVYVKYKFKCRTPNIDFSPIKRAVQDELNWLDKLKFNDDELMYLSGLRFMKKDFIDFLRTYRTQSKYVSINDGVPCGLDITVEGPWLQTILYEIYILRTVNNLYFNHHHPNARAKLFPHGEKNLSKSLSNIQTLQGVTFADFGTRRAFSPAWHDRVIQILTDPPFPGFVGTSNVYLAKKYGIKPIGTMAHEVFQVCQALTKPEWSQQFALQRWADEYRGDLGIALSDTLGIDKFLKDFDMYFAKLFDGMRHDSGTPVEWANKVIAHYESLGIDPKTKSAVFSDGLDFTKVSKIHRQIAGRIKDSYGVGTHLTNNLGPDPIQIVMKVVEAGRDPENLQPVAKLSDSKGKEMCKDDDYIAYLKKVIGR